MAKAGVVLQDVALAQKRTDYHQWGGDYTFGELDDCWPAFCIIFQLFSNFLVLTDALCLHCGTRLLFYLATNPSEKRAARAALKRSVGKVSTETQIQ